MTDGAKTTSDKRRIQKYIAYEKKKVIMNLDISHHKNRIDDL